jgi:integrase
MARGQGTVYQRPDSKYWWIAYVGRDGKQHSESSKSTRKQDAINLLEARRGDISKGIPVTPAHARMMFDAALADVVNDYRVNGRRSIDDVRQRIDDHLTPFFGGRRTTAITTDLIRGYIAERQKAGAANATINRELAIVKRAFTIAAQTNKVVFRPYVPMLEERNTRTGFFEPEQFAAVRAALPDFLSNAMAFAYITGWRVPSEVLTLEWKNVDLDAGVVTLEPETTKNREGRTFFITTELRRVLKAQRRVTDATQKRLGKTIPLVFHRDGQPVGFTMYRAWRDACAVAKVEERIPHDFRRTAVRNLVRAGVPEKVAQQMTGHKTRSIFDRYHIVAEQDLREAAAKLDALHSLTMRKPRNSRKRSTERSTSGNA